MKCPFVSPNNVATITEREISLNILKHVIIMYVECTTGVRRHRDTVC